VGPPYDHRLKRQGEALSRATFSPSSVDVEGAVSVVEVHDVSTDGADLQRHAMTGEPSAGVFARLLLLEPLSVAHRAAQVEAPVITDHRHLAGLLFLGGV